MKLEGRSFTAGRGRQRLVAILVASEVALTLMLLIATGLMVKSANRLWRIDPGFDAQNLLTMTISLPNNKFEWRHNVVFSRQVIRSDQRWRKSAKPRSPRACRCVPEVNPVQYRRTADTPVDRPSTASSRVPIFV